MKIFMGADHRGFKLKENLKEWLKGRGHEVVDLGNEEFEPEDDFPDFALKVGERVGRGEGVGILLCGSGGMALAANKIKGVRAAEAGDEERARHAKEHDNVNILTLPADFLSEKQAKGAVDVWLKAEKLEGGKYLRRLKKIQEIEKKYFKE